MQPPKPIKSLVSAGPKEPPKVADKMTPKLSQGQILVKVSAIALNPTDWKSLQAAPVGVVSGCDFCGTVEEMENVSTDIKVGDVVAGFVHGAKEQDNGAFSEYVRAEAELVWKVPKGTPMEKAAAIGGIGAETAALAILKHMGFGIDAIKSGATSAKTLLVWAASSSVGLYAVQLGRLLGLKVIGTASPKNFELVKSFGADAVFNYKDPEVAKQIKDFAPVDFALDCISEKGSTDLVAQTFGSNGGKIVILLPVQRSDSWSEKVTLDHIVVYTTRGLAFKFGRREIPQDLDDKAFAVEWLKLCTDLVADGKFRSNPLRRCPGGLEKIYEGLDYLKSGKVSAQKLVYNVLGAFNPVPQALE